MFALAVLSGVFEEILFRGILFRIVEESLGTWLSLLFSALLFGLLHLGNPNATLWAAIAIAMEAGILLAAAFIVTRRLWLVIGIHFAWNFTQGGIFSISVSGNQVDGLLQATLTGPELLAGGAFGAETSIFAVIVCLAAGVYFIWKALKKGEFVKPFWKR
ncbi:MAG: CPBP family intramembrane metalloprotease [Anaerolineales bacterium]|nr:CPBP family intramembrane metalloprotease [Anaerolineales bacterium]